jgi:hypothetical protein
MQEDHVSKSRFAKMAGVTRTRVGQWIREGKISSSAMVGTGRSARIRPSLACEQLKRNLDVDQRLGLNGMDTKLNQDEFDPGEAGLNIALKAARLQESQIRLRRLAAEEAQRRGMYMLTVDVQREIGRLATQMIMIAEGDNVELASSLAAEFKINQRQVLHLIRLKRRETRAKISSAWSQQANSMPEFVKHELAPVDVPDAEVEVLDDDNEDGIVENSELGDRVHRVRRA